MPGIANKLLRNSFGQKVYLLSAVFFLSILCLNNDYRLPEIVVKGLLMLHIVLLAIKFLNSETFDRLIFRSDRKPIPEPYIPDRATIKRVFNSKPN
jgi:hypothetical protein